MLYTPTVGMYFCVEASIFLDSRQLKKAPHIGEARSSKDYFLSVHIDGFDVRRYRAHFGRDVSCSVAAGRALARHVAAGRGLSR